MSQFGLNRRSVLIGAGAFLAAAAAISVPRKLGWLYLQDVLTLNVWKPELELHPIDDLPEDDQYDVCIVGSGPAGAVLGLDLDRSGWRTILLESGPQALEPAVEEGAGGQAASPGLIDYPLETSRFRGLGGTSTLWTGRCTRLYPLDFAVNAYTPPGAAWPIDYEELAPYYELAERTLRVSGATLSGYAPNSGNSLPLPAFANITELQLFLQHQAGITVDLTPTSNGINLTLAGPTRIANDYLPDYSASARSRLVLGAHVARLIPDRDGKIVGAEVRHPSQPPKLIRARVYVVAAGGVESARLLLLSQTAQFPQGIGNHAGLAGRYFMEHPNLHFVGTVPGMRVSRGELGRSFQFYEEFKRQGLGSLILVFSREPERPDRLSVGATLEMEPLAENRVFLSESRRDSHGDAAAELSLRFSERDLQTMERTRQLVRQIYADLGGALLREHEMSWSYHHLGTCRMGDDPDTSVIDANLRVHGSPNLYVAGSAGFVTGGAAHPTLAIVALSHRLADHLDSVLRA
jgi:choline dehydrogenase-like flavoprotein